MNIPLPKAGHWMKLQFGKKVKIDTLPETFEGEGTVTLSLREKIDPLPEIVVPDKLINPDDLVVEAKKYLTSEDTYVEHGMIRRSRNGLDISVTAKNVNRALCFMDTLIKELRKKGYEIIITNGFTYVRVKNQEFRICFREKTKRVVVSGKYSNSSEFHPVNILYFKYDGYTSGEWKDGKKKLETFLPDILTRLEWASDKLTSTQQYHRNQWEERERKVQAIIDIQMAKEKELDDFKNLLDQAERWQKTIHLRNYLQALEQNTSVNKDWLEWAHNKTDWYDPFKNIPDESFENVDVASLTFK